MAKGDVNDFYDRLKALLPSGWFADHSPVVRGLLLAGAWSLSWCYSLYCYVLKQTRISTATDGWLDIAAYDFFGTELQRQAEMSDDMFRNHISVNLFRERGTRQAVIDILQELTGNTPRVFEPQHPMDTGSYGGPVLGYGVAGGYGSQLLPYQAFVVACRPKKTGIPLIAGYAMPPSGYSMPSQGEYVSHDMVTGNVTDAQIYAAVAAVKMEGSVVWVRLL